MLRHDTQSESSHIFLSHMLQGEFLKAANGYEYEKNKTLKEQESFVMGGLKNWCGTQSWALTQEVQSRLKEVCQWDSCPLKCITQLVDWTIFTCPLMTEQQIKQPNIYITPAWQLGLKLHKTRFRNAWLSAVVAVHMTVLPSLSPWSTLLCKTSYSQQHE